MRKSIKILLILCVVSSCSKSDGARTGWRKGFSGCEFAIQNKIEEAVRTGHTIRLFSYWGSCIEASGPKSSCGVALNEKKYLKSQVCSINKRTEKVCQRLGEKHNGFCSKHEKI